MNHKQQLFAHAYIRLHDPLVAYIQSYKPKDASNYRSIMSAANRLLRNPEIAEYISSVRDAARAEAQQELKEQMKEELLTVHQKRLYIKRVINGEILIPQDYKANGCNRCTMFLRPTFPQILGYLKEDSRLAGHYPQQQKTTKKNSSFEGGVPTVERDGGCFPAPDPREEQQTATTERSKLVITNRKDNNRQQKNILDNTSPLKGDRGTLAPDTREVHATTDNKKPTSDNTSPLKRDRGTLALYTREVHATTDNKKTILDNESPLKGDRGTLAPDPREVHATTDNKKTILDNESPLKGDRGALAPEQQNATGNTSPRPGVPIAIGIGVSLAPYTREVQQLTTTERSELVATTEKDINKTTYNTSHAGLRKLLDRQRQRKNMKTESA